MQKTILILAFLLLPNLALAWIPSADMVFPCIQGKDVDWSSFGGDEYVMSLTREECKSMVVMDIETNLENRSSNIVCDNEQSTAEYVFQKTMSRFNEGAGENGTYMTLIDDVMVQDFACEKATNSDHMWPFYGSQ